MVSDRILLRILSPANGANAFVKAQETRRGGVIEKMFSNSAAIRILTDAARGNRADRR